MRPALAALVAAGGAGLVVSACGGGVPVPHAATVDPCALLSRGRVAAALDGNPAAAATTPPAGGASLVNLTLRFTDAHPDAQGGAYPGGAAAAGARASCELAPDTSAARYVALSVEKSAGTTPASAATTTLPGGWAASPRPDPGAGAQTAQEAVATKDGWAVSVVVRTAGAPVGADVLLAFLRDAVTAS